MPVNGQFDVFGKLNNIFNSASQRTTAAIATDARVSQAAAATQQVNATPPNPQAPPPAAQAATKNNPTFAGLCEALNEHQQQLVREGKYELADVYEIQFATANMANATVRKPGNSDYGQAPLQAPTANGQQLNPASNSVNNDARAAPVLAGSQIVWFIDKVMRNSSYISDQQLYVTDQVTGKSTPTSNNANGQTAWFKISASATPLPGYDNKRKDHAYKITYIVSPYAINQMQSEYFPQSKFRGLHKAYNYWFTGQNTAVLDFQQEYNLLYRQVLSGQNIPISANAIEDPLNPTRKTFMAASAQNDQGATGGANEPVANAADYLFSPGDQSTVKLRIVGDPAWIQQGEIVGLTAQSFNFGPFNADGGINYDSQQILFSVSFNKPVDYNFATGIAEVNGNSVSSGSGTSSRQARQTFNYQAVKVRSTFSRGRFEQELEGRLLTNQVTNISNAPAPQGSVTVSAAPELPIATETGATTNPGAVVAPGTTGVNDLGIARSGLRSATPDGRNTNATTVSPTPVQNDTVVPVSDNQPAPAKYPIPPPTSAGEVLVADNFNNANGTGLTTSVNPNTINTQQVVAPQKAGTLLADGTTVPSDSNVPGLNPEGISINTAQIISRET
jgi:hypothetical protein